MTPRADNNVPVAVAKPATKKKKRKNVDGTYSQRQKATTKKRKPYQGSAFHMRADHSKTVEVNGQIFPRKTAVAVKLEGIKGVDQAQLQQMLDENNAQVPTHRPVESFTHCPQTGTPIQARTPGGSILNRSHSNGVLSFFSNSVDRPKKPASFRGLSEIFKQTSAFKNVKKNSDLTKHIEVFLDKNLLKRVRRENALSSGSRSQAAVMVEAGGNAKKASANLYAAAAGLPAEFKWEWLHFIAHQFLGKASQDEKNLGCGPAFLNTKMLSVEEILEKLLAVYPHGFLLIVDAHFEKDSQLLTKIEYKIQTQNKLFNPKLNDVELKFVFDAQEEKKPHIYNLQYMQTFVNTLREMSLNAIERTSQISSGKTLVFEDDEDKENKLEESVGLKPSS